MNPDTTRQIHVDLPVVTCQARLGRPPRVGMMLDGAHVAPALIAEPAAV